MQADLKTVQTELMEETGLSLAKEDTNFFDYLHLSPLKVNNLNKSSFVIKQKKQEFVWFAFEFRTNISSMYLYILNCPHNHQIPLLFV